MGQQGYGVDQAYLWYNRAGVKLRPRIHLFAFITDDVRRMGLKVFSGHPKPYLTIQGGTLTVMNVPVPRTWFSPWLADVSGLRVLELAREVFAMQTDEEAFPTSAKDTHTRQLLHYVFGELKRTSEAQGNRVVLVYLPTAVDEVEGAREWLAFFDAESHALGIPLIDLVSPLASLPHDRFTRMFIPAEQIGGGHYSVEGHTLIAQLLYRALEVNPETSGLLTSPPVR